MSREWMARFIILILVVAAIAFPLAAWRSKSPGPLVHARMAETGGWSPESLTAEVGKPFHIRLTSDDVTHGFAVGQSELPPVDIKPGEISEVTLTFDKPGKYTYYCTRWCSVNHWRMRGTIEVKGGDNGSEEPVAPPLYVRLGLDIDAIQLADVIPEKKPSAARGESLEALSRQFAVEVYRLERWREQALSGMDLALKERTGDPLQGELDQALRRIGELSMENELLWQRVRSKPGPLAKRRSSK